MNFRFFFFLLIYIYICVCALFTFASPVSILQLFDNYIRDRLRFFFPFLFYFLVTLIRHFCLWAVFSGVYFFSLFLHINCISNCIGITARVGLGGVGWGFFFSFFFPLWLRLFVLFFFWVFFWVFVCARGDSFDIVQFLSWGV